MISLLVGAIFGAFDIYDNIKLTCAGSDFKCKILDITENNNYGLPAFPVDNASYKSDTIYELPKTLNVRVYVLANDINTFEAQIKKANFSSDLITLTSLYNKTYENYKIAGVSRETNAQMLGATFYNLSLQEVIFVSALAENYKSSKSGGYGAKKELGTKNAPERKQSALFGGGKMVGAF